METNQLLRTFFFLTSYNQKVFDIIRSQRLIKGSTSWFFFPHLILIISKADFSSHTETRPQKELELQTGNTEGLRLRSEGCDQSSQVALLSRKTILCWAEQFKTQVYTLLFLNQNFKMCHLCHNLCIKYSSHFPHVASESFTNVKKYHLHTFRVFF